MVKNKLGQQKEKNSIQLTFLSRKGQMKIQQMSFMLIALFILFVLIGIAVISVKVSNLNRTATELGEQNALKLVSKLSNSPEFSCGNSYGNQKTDCIDLDKVRGLKSNINNYDNFWGVSNIEVRIIYPVPDEEIECTAGNYPDCNWLNLREDASQGVGVSNFVSVCHKESKENSVVNVCELGKIIVSYEVVQ